MPSELGATGIGAGSLHMPAGADANALVAPLPPAKAAEAGGKALPARPMDPAAAGDLTAATEKLNRYARSLGRDLQFTVDAQDGRTIVRVLDSQTKELIRQIPPENVLRMARRIGELHQGQLFAELA